MTRVHGIDLLNDEKVDLVTKPHPFAFLKYHVVSVYLIFVAIFLGWFHSFLKSDISVFNFISSIFGFIPGIKPEDFVLLFLFWVILILSGFVVGTFWVSKMPLFYMISIGLIGTSLELYFLASYNLILIPKPFLKLFILGAGAVLGILLTELYRKRHSYIITNLRVITKKEFIQKEERELMYDKITDVYVNQGFLGKIFNYGTIIPISNSGFGLGEDSATVQAVGGVPVKKGFFGALFGGGKSVQKPRASTYFSLYGIPNPRKIRVIIGNRQQETREAPILRRIEKHLKEKNFGEN
jgi:hypothetical protein